MRKLAGKTVLVVEDEPDIRKFVTRVLKLEGYGSLETGDAIEGLRLLRQNQVDLLLLDLRLPGYIDGWKVLEQVKADLTTATIPVIVFTASAGVYMHDKAASMGAADYLVKPLSAASLAKAIAAGMARNDNAE